MFLISNVDFLFNRWVLLPLRRAGRCIVRLRILKVDVFVQWSLLSRRSVQEMPEPNSSDICWRRYSILIVVVILLMGMLKMRFVCRSKYTAATNDDDDDDEDENDDDNHNYIHLSSHLFGVGSRWVKKVFQISPQQHYQRKVSRRILIRCPTTSADSFHYEEAASLLWTC